jgi:hypothetical protein
MTTHALLQRLPLEALDATDEDGSAAPVVGSGRISTVAMVSKISRTSGVNTFCACAGVFSWTK